MIPAINEKLVKYSCFNVLGVCIRKEHVRTQTPNFKKLRRTYKDDELHLIQRQGKGMWYIEETSAFPISIHHLSLIV